jgi:hypothetical protein
MQLRVFISDVRQSLFGENGITSKSLQIAGSGRPHRRFNSPVQRSRDGSSQPSGQEPLFGPVLVPTKPHGKSRKAWSAQVRGHQTDLDEQIAAAASS